MGASGVPKSHVQKTLPGVDERVRIPQSAGRGELLIPVARRDLSEVARGPEDHEPRDGNRHRGNSGD